jgi:predicted DNA-binding transcriptional regulator AlpA
MLIKRLKTKEAAQYIGCSQFTLRTSRVMGTLYGYPSPIYIKLGRSVLYDKKAIEEWIDKYSKSMKNSSEEL